MDADGRYSRNELLFGAEGQAKIAKSKVGIVGLGGLGSHTAQQLAYLGVLDYALVDADDVTESNLNRLIGAVPEDIGTEKVAIAERMIKGIQPVARVTTITAMVPGDEISDALADRSCIFGCLDHETPRLQLTEFAASRGIVYIDAASDVDDGEFGGRVVVARGSGCLHCLDVIDQEELRLEGLTPDQRTAHDEIYGVPQGALDQAGPSVVSVNGVVASLAVTEFMAHTTGLREPVPYLNYRGRFGIVTRPDAKPAPGCPYCSRWPASPGTSTAD